MNVSVDELFQIIGQLYVENIVIRKNVVAPEPEPLEPLSEEEVARAFEVLDGER